jgi:hypothetical protein
MMQVQYPRGVECNQKETNWTALVLTQVWSCGISDKVALEQGFLSTLNSLLHYQSIAYSTLVIILGWYEYYRSTSSRRSK